MDLVKSRISGHLFLYPVPHPPTYTSIRLHISRGFSSGCKVYIRPSEDVAVTGISLGTAPAGPSPTHRTGPASLFASHPNQTFREQLVQRWQSVLTFFCWVTSSSVPRHGHSDTGDPLGTGCGGSWHRPGSSHPRQPGQRWHPARLGAEHARHVAGAGETQILPILFKLSVELLLDLIPSLFHP